MSGVVSLSVTELATGKVSAMAKTLESALVAPVPSVMSLALTEQ
jgi:hypothetical protein